MKFGKPKMEDEAENFSSVDHFGESKCRVQQQAKDLVRIGSWKRDEDYPIYPIGSKPKRLVVCPETCALPFLIPRHKYLFKIAKEWQSYQTWSEIISYEIGKILQIYVPPCFAAFDETNNDFGVLVEFFINYPNEPRSPQFVHGSDLLQRHSISYNQRTGRPHDVRDNLALSRALKIREATAWWAKVLAFDTLIGNTDRHAENWGCLVYRDADQQPYYSMAPVFDNGTSLGYEQSEAKLLNGWPVGKFNLYIGKGSHHCSWAGSNKGAKHLELCRLFSKSFVSALPAMREVLACSDSQISRILAWSKEFAVPVPMSEARASFIEQLLRIRRDALISCLESET